MSDPWATATPQALSTGTKVQLRDQPGLSILRETGTNGSVTLTGGTGAGHADPLPRVGEAPDNQRSPGGSRPDRTAPQPGGHETITRSSGQR
jgi:hypothetical protein